MPDSLVERAQRKLAKLDHYLPLLRDATVEVDVAHQKAKEPSQRYLVHVLVDGSGVHLRAEEHAAKPEAALDEAAKAVTKQARRHKERLYGRSRARTKEPPLPVPEVAGAAGRIARTKRFPIKPMTVEEAMEEMELLGHAFFVYHDAEAETFAVLYRRRAGDYGVIIPELP